MEIIGKIERKCTECGEINDCYVIEDSNRVLCRVCLDIEREIENG
jgi:hypothetical protein